MTGWDVRNANRALLAEETGAMHKEADRRIALVYPSPYRAAMSSLGYQAVYARLNALPGFAADRAVLPDDDAAALRDGVPLLTLEREVAVGDYPVVAFSMAWELEIPGLLTCLELARIPLLAAERGPTHPLVVAGGPLTFSNPAPLGPFCDLVALGEGENLVDELAMMVAGSHDRGALLAELAGHLGWYVPSIHGDHVPRIARARDDQLPARSAILAPRAELASMFLTEAARGCSRGCTYCVMRRSTNGGMRIVPAERVLAGIPAPCRRVGVVGAAVTDHPRIAEIVRTIVDGGREIGISSLRADRLTDELVGLLARGGYRTMTIAADGASERLRAAINRRTYERHLVAAAGLASRHGLRQLKIYMMVGLPGETDADIDELIRFTLELARIHPRVALGVSPFVAKRNTPMDGAPFAGIDLVEDRLRRLRSGLKGRAEVRPTSARWAWVEYMLAQGSQLTGLAAMDAWRAGGTFAAWKRAFAARGAVTGRGRTLPLLTDLQVTTTGPKPTSSRN